MPALALMLMLTWLTIADPLLSFYNGFQIRYGRRVKDVKIQLPWKLASCIPEHIKLWRSFAHIFTLSKKKKGKKKQKTQREVAGLFFSPPAFGK